MDIKNAYHNHLGVATYDTNVNHTRWPCISHPANMACEDALRILSRKPPHVLTPAPARVPAREWVDKR